MQPASIRLRALGARSGLACPQQRPPSPLRAPCSVPARCAVLPRAPSAAPRVERVRLPLPVRSSWSSNIIPWPGRSFALDRPGVAYAKKPARWKRSRPRPPLLFLRVAGFRNVSTSLRSSPDSLLPRCLVPPSPGVRSTPTTSGSSGPAARWSPWPARVFSPQPRLPCLPASAVFLARSRLSPGPP